MYVFRNKQREFGLLSLPEDPNLIKKCEIFFYISLCSMLTLQLVSTLHKDCRSLKALAILASRTSRHLQNRQVS